MTDNSPPSEPIVDQAAMTTEQLNVAIARLNERLPGSGKCPLCAPGQFTMAAHFVSATLVSPSGGLMIGGGNYPCLMLICNNCGHTRLHNAIILDVFPKAQG